MFTQLVISELVYEGVGGAELLVARPEDSLQTSVNRDQLSWRELELEMPQVFVTRRETFSAAHRLHSNQLTDEENRELYGPCNNLFGHGHNYSIEVSLA